MACATLPCPMQYPTCIRHVLHTGNYKWAKPSCWMALVQSQIEWRHATLALLPRFPLSLLFSLYASCITFFRTVFRFTRQQNGNPKITILSNQSAVSWNGCRGMDVVDRSLCRMLLTLINLMIVVLSEENLILVRSRNYG